MEYNVHKQTVWRDGAGEVHLSPLEAGFFEQLLKANGGTVRFESLAHAWGDGKSRDDQKIHTTVSRLNKKILDLCLSVESDRGLGYRLRVALPRRS